MSKKPTRGAYWTLVDVSTSGYTETYEHPLPHGKLVRVATHRPDGSSETVVFVPAAGTAEPYR